VEDVRVDCKTPFPVPSLKCAVHAPPIVWDSSWSLSIIATQTSCAFVVAAVVETLAEVPEEPLTAVPSLSITPVNDDPLHSESHTASNVLPSLFVTVNDVTPDGMLGHTHQYQISWNPPESETVTGEEGAAVKQVSGLLTLSLIVRAVRPAVDAVHAPPSPQA
jgi:hypothetical protein